MNDDGHTELPTAPFDGPATMPRLPAWWEHERALLIRDQVDALAPRGGRIVDVGCGRGTMLSDPRLADRFAVHVDSHVWEEWKDRAGNFVCARADALPFRDGAFDLVGSFDVIEHLDDDIGALTEQRRITAAAGHVIIAVPASPRLWSGHDDAVGHLRRYTARSLRTACRAAGLGPRRITHFFSYLWLPAWLSKGSSSRQQVSEKHGLGGKIVAAVIHLVSAAERKVIVRWSLPFGSSLFAETKPYPDRRSWSRSDDAGGVARA